MVVVVMLLVLPLFAQQKPMVTTGRKNGTTKTATPGFGKAIPTGGKKALDSFYSLPGKHDKPLFVAAAFPGGQKALDSFLLVSIHYPENAKEAGVQGRVVVKFMINEKGMPTDARVTRGIGAGCDEEAKRVVNAMPRWKPATYKKKPVKMMIVLPMAFKLE